MSACFPFHLHWYHLPFILFDSTRPPPTSRTHSMSPFPLLCAVQSNWIKCFLFFPLQFSSIRQHVWFIQQLLVLSWSSVLNTSTSSTSYAVRRTASTPSTSRSFYRKFFALLLYTVHVLSSYQAKVLCCIFLSSSSIHITIQNLFWFQFIFILSSCRFVLSVTHLATWF